MKRKIGMALATAGVLVAAFVGYRVYDNRPTGTIPKQVFEKMKFPKTLAETTGDPATGLVCHQVVLRTPNGDQMLASHDLLGYDFRTMTEGQKREALKADTRKDMEQVGLACREPGGDWFFREATAQRYCESCGGGCGVISCPAHIIEGGTCELSGPNCVISFVCCDVGCTCANYP